MHAWFVTVALPTEEWRRLSCQPAGFEDFYSEALVSAAALADGAKYGALEASPRPLCLVRSAQLPLLRDLRHEFGSLRSPAASGDSRTRDSRRPDTGDEEIFRFLYQSVAPGDGFKRKLRIFLFCAMRDHNQPVCQIQSHVTKSA